LVSQKAIAALEMKPFQVLGRRDRQRFGFIRLVLVWLSLRSRLQELEQRGVLGFDKRNKKNNKT
jgi:hypothetical protein